MGEARISPKQTKIRSTLWLPSRNQNRINSKSNSNLISRSSAFLGTKKTPFSIRPSPLQFNIGAVESKVVKPDGVKCVQLTT